MIYERISYFVYNSCNIWIKLSQINTKIEFLPLYFFYAIIGRNTKKHSFFIMIKCQKYIDVRYIGRRYSQPLKNKQKSLIIQLITRCRITHHNTSIMVLYPLFYVSNPMEAHKIRIAVIFPSLLQFNLT